MQTQNVDHCAQPGLMSVEDAILNIKCAIQPISDYETVFLMDALDRVIAAPIYSPINVPAHDNSAMDGYALRAQDSGKTLQLIGQALAGHAFNEQVESGECVRITTGAVIPEGADCVAIQEEVTYIGDKVSLQNIAQPGANIRKAGEDIAQGSLVFEKGHRISAIDIGLLASLGCAEVQVYRRLRVAVLSTGDELTPIGQPLLPGNIYDSNRYALRALLTRLNVEVIDIGLIADNREQISLAFNRAMQSADAVISSGGVSVGDADYTKDVLEQLGQINFWKVAMKPGKPFAFGTLGAGYFFGLPGNPVSSVVTYHQLVLPGLRQLAGEVFSSSHFVYATTTEPLKKQSGRADYQRGFLYTENNLNLVKSTGAQSSGMLTSMAQANCYIVLEKESGSLNAGEVVRVLPFDNFIK